MFEVVGGCLRWLLVGVWSCWWVFEMVVGGCLELLVGV